MYIYVYSPNTWDWLTYQPAHSRRRESGTQPPRPATIAPVARTRSSSTFAEKRKQRGGAGILGICLSGLDCNSRVFMGLLMVI